MTMPIIIGVAAVLFILGVIFIFKTMSSEDQDAVPISNPHEIKELTNAFKPKKSAEEESEPKNKFTELLKKAEANVPTNADDQKRIAALKEENQHLKQKIQEYQNALGQLEQSVHSLKAEYSRVKEGGLEAIKRLEERIAGTQSKKETSLVNQNVIEELKGKAEAFEEQLKENHTQQTQMQETILQLEAQRKDLVNQQTQIDKSEIEELGNRLAGSIAALETIKSENKNLLQSNEELKNNFQKTEEHNKLLVEKEKAIHFELAKNRAQALGLEKICEDFKVQIETMTALAAKQEQT